MHQFLTNYTLNKFYLFNLSEKFIEKQKFEILFLQEKKLVRAKIFSKHLHNKKAKYTQLM